jgi:Leucine-rich repeat (LRR) protein
MIKYLTSEGKIIEEKYDEKTKFINLSFKNIKRIIKTKRLNNLENLWLHNNQITEIKGLNGLTKLRELWLHNNQITEIKGLNGLTKLRELWLNNNQITEIKRLEKLNSLQNLWLNNNQITEIKGLYGLTSLQILLLNNNQITEIKGLDGLTSLQYLSLSNNQITEIKGLIGLNSLQDLTLESNQIIKIKGLNELTRLQKLWLHNNQITDIKGLDELTSLRFLSLYNNRIIEIKGLDGLTNLQDLWLNNNQISKIPYSIMNLRKLVCLNVDCDIDPIIQRFLDRNIIKDQKTIYGDSQNVHNSHIVKSIKQSIYNIISESKETNIDLILKDIINDKILNETTKQQLVEYCQDKTIHSILNLTFDEILCSVWKIISEHKESNEIKKILNEEMKDSMCKCFTGRLSRLVNCLNGFDSRVSIKINDKEQILNIIIKIRNKYLDDISKQKEEAAKELLERGYDKNTINEYIIYLE